MADKIEPWKIFEENEMRKLITIIALLSANAAPAFAQAFVPSLGTGNVGTYEYVCRGHNNSCRIVDVPALSSTSSASSAYAQGADLAKTKAPGLPANEHVGYHGI